ncbi:potassium channel protein [Flavobacteriaceae bacterium Ap0902]|nr:potassium channel protein [Flavobacteriaceae bacterium Ap0902]
MLKIIHFKITIVFFILLIFLGLGTLGYILIEDFTFVDALYMSVITLSTVGFGEVNQLSEAGRLFTIFLILSGVGLIAYAASIFAEELVSGKIVNYYKKRNVENKVKKIDEHVIICGFGRNGRQAARKLKTYNKPFIVVEHQVKELDPTHGIKDVIFVNGDATNDDVLERAQIRKATALISALPSDADNLFIVLTARQINPKLKIISRASNRTSMRKLKIAGADNVIMPDKIGGEHMASLIVTPDLIEFLDKISVDSSRHINMIEVSVEDLPKEFLGKNIRQLNLRSNTGCTIIGLKDNNGDYQINPEYYTVLEPGMHFIVLGRPEQINKLNQLYSLQ